MAATIPQTEEKQLSPPPPGSTTCVKEMALEAPASPLPPGIYFRPTRAESVLTYLNRWIAGDPMPDARGWVIEDDVYRESPGTLTRKYSPTSTRNAEPSWWFLCHCKMQAARGGAPRGLRRVATGGNWTQEQTRQKVECATTGRRLGFRRAFAFFVHHGKDKKEQDVRPKTWWLMEEFTSVACPEDGIAGDGGKKVLPALYRMYLTTRDPGKKNKNKKRGREGDGVDDDDGGDGAPIREDPGRLVVPADYFDAIAALLPPSSVLGVGQEQTEDAQEAPPPSPPPLPGVFDQDAYEEITASLMARGAPLADSSWIEHYLKPAE